MYISKLVIKNIKCFEEIIIDFSIASDVCMWGTILGDNGLGKTTILRSIAMCLSGEGSASGLVDEMEGGWIKKEKEKGSIRLEFMSDEKRKEPIYIEMNFGKESGDADIVESIDTSKDFQWNKLFVCGYGATRGVVGVESYSAYSVTDAVYTLFGPDTLLQNPELIMRRIKDTKGDEVLDELLNRITTILMLPKGSMLLNKTGLSVNGPWGLAVPVGALADGHHATITWISDLLGWALFYDENALAKEISGIVLMDEIEQHLHPKWQREIGPLLKKTFPKIQFITATHSPFVAANSVKLMPDESESRLFYLSLVDKVIQVSKVEENLSELGVDQILSSEAFGYIFNINKKVEDILREASILAGKDKRTDEEEATLKKFKEALKEIMFPKGKTLIERFVERNYYDELEKKTEDLKRILDGEK